MLGKVRQQRRLFSRFRPSVESRHRPQTRFGPDAKSSASTETETLCGIIAVVGSGERVHAWS